MNYISEGYLWKEEKYHSRVEFSDLNNLETLNPHFFAKTNFSDTFQETFYDSILRELSQLKRKNKPIYLLFSGGIDSELLLIVAAQNNIDVVPVIVDLFGMNSYELHFAFASLKRWGIKDYLLVKVSEEDIHKRWLPELVLDCENLSFLLLGAYIAARSCPLDGIIVYPGENPDLIYCKDNSVFVQKNEYSLWFSKLGHKRSLETFELFNSTNVLANYFRYPALIERINSQVPFAEWFVDQEYLGKEFLHEDPAFKNLPRRYPQHGWEFKVGQFTYQKGLLKGSPSQSKEPLKRYVDESIYLKMLAEYLNERVGKVANFNFSQLKNSHFSSKYYFALGRLIDSQLVLNTKTHQVISLPDGQIHEKLL